MGCTRVNRPTGPEKRGHRLDLRLKERADGRQRRPDKAQLPQLDRTTRIAAEIEAASGQG
jgi:hypothetical protein